MSLILYAAFFSTSLGSGCIDLSKHRNSYLHIIYSGSAKFTVSLRQHNVWCDEKKIPFPETSDSVEAARYSKDQSNIYIPLSHFDVELKRLNAIALEGFYSMEATYFYRIEIVKKLPPRFSVPSKLPTGTLHFACSQPGLIAFGIDDGSPALVQATLQTLYEENVPATFFVQGKALVSKEDNFSNAYREAHHRGYQIALHSFDHPRMESLQTEKEIEREIQENVHVFLTELNIKSHYFRPPYGTVAARTRQSVAKILGKAQIIQWSIDVKDWLYGSTDNLNQRKQYKIFKKRLMAGGDIVVMHYLHKSTVDQLRDMIRLAKQQGRRFVRMDQCVNDPEAPLSWGWTRPS